MPIFVLPISTRRALVYAARLGNAPASNASASLLDRATDKATAVWAQWERADAGWKKRVVGWGNAAFARIPYQEWGLKSVRSFETKPDTGTGHLRLKYPAAFCTHKQVDAEVRTLATDRAGYHKRRMWASLVGIPFTAPIMLIPM